MDTYCGRCSGGWVVAIGILFLVKEYVFINMSWGFFLALLLIFVGVMRMIKPSCGCGGYCCGPPIGTAQSKKKK
jgi:hypothetical protein